MNASARCTSGATRSSPKRNRWPLDGERLLASPEMMAPYRAQFLTEVNASGATTDVFRGGHLSSPKTHGRGLARAGRRILGPGRPQRDGDPVPLQPAPR
jgi:hypothetical protein